MKYLNDYTETAQTELFKKTGSFFAFGTEQFNKQAVDGVKYVSCGAGLICPKHGDCLTHILILIILTCFNHLEAAYEVCDLNIIYFLVLHLTQRKQSEP